MLNVFEQFHRMNSFIQFASIIQLRVYLYIGPQHFLRLRTLWSMIHANVNVNKQNRATEMWGGGRESDVNRPRDCLNKISHLSLAVFYFNIVLLLLFIYLPVYTFAALPLCVSFALLVITYKKKRLQNKTENVLPETWSLFVLDVVGYLFLNKTCNATNSQKFFQMIEIIPWCWIVIQCSKVAIV